jgi:hypothetical protein
MNASITGAPVDCRHSRRVSFHNHYSSATPSGNFTYEITNDPGAGTNPSAAQWTTVTPTTTYGAQPAGSAAVTFAVVFVDLFRFIRQKWTRVAGGSGDLLNTWVDCDDN